jgi:site-specific DNA-methyltransferase (adenine-specific)
MRPYYAAGGVTVYHAKFEEVLDGLAPVDAIVTDPPYGETSLEWDVWPNDWPWRVRNLARCLWCFGSFRMFLEHAEEFKCWRLAQDLVWEKHNGSGPHSDRFRRVHECAVQFYQGEWSDLFKSPPVVPHPEGRKSGSLSRKSKPAHFGGVSNGKYEYGGSRLERSVIPVRSCHGKAVNETQKPEGIIEPLLKYSVPPGGTVLDVFAGSGTVGVVARRLGMKAILIEQRESQCEEIVARLRGTLAL